MEIEKIFSEGRGSRDGRDCAKKLDGPYQAGARILIG